jgi:menaquinol-cytochrome c reductase iron-sulfur subunit
VADDLERPDDRERHEGRPHLPSPSIWPFAFAVGVALVLLALVISSWLILAIGAAIAIVFGFLWVSAATREVRAEAPPPPPARPAAVAARADEEEEDEEPARYPRSVFLEGATLGIGAVIGGIVTLPAVGFAVLPAFLDQGYDDVDLGPLENFPEGEWIVTKFLSTEGQTENVARRTAYIRNNGVANGEASFTILSNRCVHLGCPVQPQGLTEEEPREVETESGPVQLFGTNPSGWVCPCHGGSYTVEGNRQAGPPVRALDRYRYSIRDGRLVLGDPYSVADVEGEGAEAQINAFELHDPGQPVAGEDENLLKKLEAWLFYPYVP